MFIRKPFVVCPKCTLPTFGVVSVQSDSYLRRCNNPNCEYSRSGEAKQFPLPALRKKLIYLDQSILSNIMKSLNPNAWGHEKAKSEPLWIEIFRRLSTLTAMQVVICPKSESNLHESAVSPFYEDLRKLYHHLSFGQSFHPSHQIRLNQLSRHIEWVVNGRIGAIPPPEDRDATSSRIHNWQDVIFVALPQDWARDEQGLLRGQRENTHNRLREIYKRWQSENGRDLMQWYREECAGFGKGVIEVFHRHIARLRVKQAQGYRWTPDDITPPLSTDYLESVRLTLESRGLSRQDALRSGIEYFRSDHLCELPFNHIQSLLWAAIARRYSRGKKKAPDSGMYNDVETISCLLPYCDAMFVDNMCRSLLNEDDVRSRVEYDCLVFSKDTGSGFLDYLEGVREEVSNEHRARLVEVYGEIEPAPYIDMFSPQ